MTPFRYTVARDIAEAVALTSSQAGAQFIAGGTSQVDLMQEGVQRPTLLVDVSGLGLDKIEFDGDRGLRIGANVRNSVAADHPEVKGHYRAIAEALHVGASQQIRNMASMAGNLLQRTRCPYLRDEAQACNKRRPGSGCAAVKGFNRVHAIFGQNDEGSDSPRTCIAVHPSDLAVALAAHEAVILVHGTRGERRIAFDQFHRLAGVDPSRDTALQPGDLIVAIEVPGFRGTSHYLKVRDRASYAYALVSCAAAVETEDGRIVSARIALGSVAHKPWRLPAAERLVQGQPPHAALFHEAAVAALDGARTYPMNRYKPALARALVQRVLAETTGLSPLSGPPGTAFAASVGGVAGPREDEPLAAVSATGR